MEKFIFIQEIQKIIHQNIRILLIEFIMHFNHMLNL